ncbi:sensor histidine kinase [Undibacterium sp. TC4M20W]|uniref:sensor histidine kinase n=1 Tax=Undibacterium sp. TC4M20W TaxID=3413052 RepID=UPI003BF068A3
MTELKRKLQGIWPNSLFSRLAFVWILALLLGHLINNVYGYISIHEDQIARTDYYLTKDLSVLLPILDAATPSERKLWMEKMQRHAYHYELSTVAPDYLATSTSKWTNPHRRHGLADPLKEELATSYAARSSVGLYPGEMGRLYFSLKDGSVLIAIINKIVWPVDWGAGLVFALQMLAVITFTWLAVKQATRPLQRLAEAADTLGSSLHGEAIPVDGPSEVARAAAAFNAMQAQIKEHLAERVQILASISHDLQTPITRMRLRAELMDDGSLQEKMLNDLDAMQQLVEEGITYARSARRTTEEVCRVDIDALLDSLVCDYVDAQHAVRLSGEIGTILSSRPNTLKRIMINLIDNALKFAGDVEIQLRRISPGQISVSVLDRGPGIPDSEMAAVLQPFYRVENSRNRKTGGTGLGLAIAQQLALAVNGSITLSNRDGGGLEAKLIFPVAAETK